MRGSGDSEGHMSDMYAVEELQDARDVIEWIAAQPWCNGRVGMFGTSWGGTASLQAAVRSPGPLMAVIANCATVNRFEDDIHWMGGSVLTDTLEWGCTLPAILASPPDSATVGDAWWDMWQARLETLAFPHHRWIAQARRDPYWRRGSVLFEADYLDCPILAIGGWSDRYSNSVIPLVQARPDICRGIVGPWGHHYPDHGEPGPDMSFQHVALDWWDHWLRDGSHGVDRWPALRVWQRSFDPPQDRLNRRCGDWFELQDMPEGRHTTFHLSESGLSDAPTETADRFAVPFDLRHGQCAGDTGYFGRVGGLPLDQSADDALSRCFDTAPLDMPLRLFGVSVLECAVAPDLLPAQIVCRLCDVAPDGRSNLITRSLVTLQRDDTQPPGSLDIRLAFPTTAYDVAPGHRLRLAIAGSYWPLIWPVGTATRPEIDATTARLRVGWAPELRRMQVPFPTGCVESANKPSRQVHAEGRLTRRQQVDTAGGLHNDWHQPKVTLAFHDIGVHLSYETRVAYACDPDDPATIQAEISHSIEVAREDGIALIQSTLTAKAGTQGPVTRSRLTARWNGRVVRELP